LVDILKFDGFFDAKFHILKPRWLPTAEFSATDFSDRSICRTDRKPE